MFFKYVFKFVNRVLYLSLNTMYVIYNNFVNLVNETKNVNLNTLIACKM